MRDLSSPKSSNALMVDIPWIGPVTGKEKFIFSRNKSPSILFKLKKLIRGDRMQQEAKKKLIRLCENKNESKVAALLNNIKKKSGATTIDVTAVLNAFSKASQADAFNTHDLLTDMPAELVSAVKDYENQQLATPVTTIELISTIEQYQIRNKLPQDIITKLSYGLTLLKDFHINTEPIENLTDLAQLHDLLSRLDHVFKNDARTPYLVKIAAEINMLSSKAKAKYEKSVAEQINASDIQIKNLPRWLLNPKKISQEDYRYLADNLPINMPVLKSSKNNQQAYQAFLDFIEDPKKYAGDKQTRRHLHDFLNLFYEDINQLDPQLRSACLIQIDRLEGVLQHDEQSDLHAYPTADLNTHALATLETLRSEIEINGPSSSLYHLFQYVLHRENAITAQSFWHLSSLTNIQKENISENLPPETRKKFISAMRNLEQDLKEFKQKNILERLNLLLKASDARSRIIAHLASKLNSMALFKDNMKNKSALFTFLDQLNNTSADFISSLIKEELEKFFRLFFDNIKQLDPDTRILCLREIDRQKGLILTAQRADIENYNLTKLKNNSVIDFATALQLNAEQLGPSGFVMDLLHYLEHGSTTITPFSFWALNHIATIKYTDITLLLGSPQKIYFSEAINQLRQDLNAFKAAQIPSVPS